MYINLDWQGQKINHINLETIKVNRINLISVKEFNRVVKKGFEKLNTKYVKKDLR